MPSKFIRNYLPEFVSLGSNPQKPRHVSVNLTDNCNQHCIYCEIGAGIPSDGLVRINPDDMKWIIDEMSIARINKLSLCGGEPFLFEGLIGVVDYAAGKKIRTSITSNGMTIHELDRGDLQVLVKSRVQINISIDSFDHRIQSMTRGSVSSLPNAEKSIHLLQEKKLPVTLLAAITKYNFHDLFNLVQVAFKKGIREVLFQPVIFESNYPDRKCINDKRSLNVPLSGIDELMAQLEMILDFEKRNHINTNVYRIKPWIKSYLQSAGGENGNVFFEHLLPGFYCREIYAIIEINYNGIIQPCGLAKGEISIKENRGISLIKLWEKATKSLRNDLKTGKYPEICNACCHHFSRNMLASVMHHPLRNRKALGVIGPLMLSRLIYKGAKNINSQS